ncbi:MAG: VanZ family protein [Chloroflexi bacterium]|nr:VanZ family protein [Chloroflexota bacterium]
MAAIWTATSLPAQIRAGAMDRGGTLADIPGFVAHIAAYAVLAWAFALALRQGAHLRLRSGVLPGSFLLATANGALDEYHQTFLPAHGGWPDDVGWNALGALLAVLSIVVLWLQQRGHGSAALQFERRT